MSPRALSVRILGTAYWAKAVAPQMLVLLRHQAVKIRVIFFPLHTVRQHNLQCWWKSSWSWVIEQSYENPPGNSRCLSARRHQLMHPSNSPRAACAQKHCFSVLLFGGHTDCWKLTPGRKSGKASSHRSPALQNLGHSPVIYSAWFLPGTEECSVNQARLGLSTPCVFAESSSQRQVGTVWRLWHRLAPPL